MVSFDQIPSGSLVPFTFVEFNGASASQAPAIQSYRGLCIGQRQTGQGDTAELLVKTAFSGDEVGARFGARSMIRGMADRIFAANQSVPFDFVAIDDASGTAATGTFAFSGGPATAAGTVYAYVAGRRFAVGVSVGDTATEIGDALEAAINADPTLPATAANVTGTVTITAVHDGTLGNDIDLRLNYYAGEETPAGITAAVTPMASGATDPDVQDVFDALSDQQYHVIVSPFRDTSNLNALRDELADRASATRAIEGYGFVGGRGTVSALTTIGSGPNSGYMSLIGAEAAPHPTWEWAAAAAAAVSQAAQAAPGRPFQTLELEGILPPAEADQWDYLERDTALKGGVSTFRAQAGRVLIERLVSTYRTNAFGATDSAFLNANVAFVLSYLRFSLRARITSRFPRHSLAQDGTLVEPGSAVVTPATIRSELTGLFGEWSALNLVEDPAQFERDLVVQINPQEPDRLDVYLRPNLINQFRQFAAQIAFLL